MVARLSTLALYGWDLLGRRDCIAAFGCDILVPGVRPGEDADQLSDGPPIHGCFVEFDLVGPPHQVDCAADVRCERLPVHGRDLVEPR
eukprot:scaffold1750_cov211-Pinguiococcus_pyrenoidosus.AAC.1